jgi:hypothetical protein
MTSHLISGFRFFTRSYQMERSSCEIQVAAAQADRRGFPFRASRDLEERVKQGFEFGKFAFHRKTDSFFPSLRPGAPKCGTLAPGNQRDACGHESPGRGFRHACGAPGHLYGKCDRTQNVLSGRIAAIRAADSFEYPSVQSRTRCRIDNHVEQMDARGDGSGLSVGSQRDRRRGHGIEKEGAGVDIQTGVSRGVGAIEKLLEAQVV